MSRPAAGLVGVVRLRRGTGAVIVGEAVLAVLGVGVDPGRDGVAVNREDVGDLVDGVGAGTQDQSMGTLTDTGIGAVVPESLARVGVVRQ